MKRLPASSVGLLAIVFAVGCAPVIPSRDAKTSDAGPAQAPQRTMVVSVRAEPKTLSAGFQAGSVATSATPVRLFNAALDFVDNRGEVHPYLAEAVPQLNSNTWRVFPDGRMETRYRLKPNLTWHDGTPASAEDFAFAWRVYLVPDLGLSGFPPLSEIEEILAADAQTVVIRWKRLYPRAGLSQIGGYMRGIMPFPRHLLEEAFNQQRWEAFASHPYWTREFVGLGPYRLQRWEPGAFIEGTAYDGHVLGQPKIQRVKLVFIEDQPAVLANMLAGEVHFAADSSIGFDQVTELVRLWGPGQGGTILSSPQAWRAVWVQLRPELTTPRALSDVRVRRALAHAIDRPALAEAVSGDRTTVADTFFLPASSYYQAIDRAIAKYPYDLRRTDALMAEAGFPKTSSGAYGDSAGARLSVELQSQSDEAERAIMADGWRQAGFEVRETTLSRAQALNRSAVANFPSLLSYALGSDEDNVIAAFTTAGIPRPENRFSGNNQGGWSNERFDSLADALSSTLDPDERVQLRTRVARLFSEELPAMSVMYKTNHAAYVKEIRGVPPTRSPGSTGIYTWNIQDWEFD